MAENQDVFLEQEEDTQRGKFLSFVIGEEEYGIEIRYVTEIIGIQNITAVPDLPAYVKGIINLRGKIIPVIDVRLRFRKEPMEYNDRTCIIVVDIDGISVGLIVDNVSEVLSMAEESIVPPPDTRTGFHNRYIKGIGKVANKVILILDGEVLLQGEELESLTHS